MSSGVGARPIHQKVVCCELSNLKRNIGRIGRPMFRL